MLRLKVESGAGRVIFMNRVHCLTVVPATAMLNVDS